MHGHKARSARRGCRGRGHALRRGERYGRYLLLLVGRSMLVDKPEMDLTETAVDGLSGDCSSDSCLVDNVPVSARIWCLLASLAKCLSLVSAEAGCLLVKLSKVEMGDRQRDLFPLGLVGTDDVARLCHL